MLLRTGERVSAQYNWLQGMGIGMSMACKIQKFTWSSLLVYILVDGMSEAPLLENVSILNALLGSRC
jgi:hypothetical protein